MSNGSISNKALDELKNDYEFKSCSNSKQLLRHYGYTIDKKILTVDNNDELLICVNHNKNNEPVVIKKIPAMDCDGFRFVADYKQISTILHSNKSNEKSQFANFIDFFESKTHYFLVLEYNFNVNLSEFISKCYEYMKNGQLKPNHYRKTIRYLLWRIVQITRVIHSKGNNVQMNNIMVRNADFISDSDGKFVSIHHEIDIVYIGASMLGLVDTSRVNISNDDIDECNLYNLGVIMFYCFTGYLPWRETKTDSYNALCAIRDKKLKEYFLMNNVTLCLNNNILSLLNGLLNINHLERLDLNMILTHSFFKKLTKS